MIGHACVLASHNGQSLLFDPWFGRAVNFGTFSGYPKFVPPTDEEVASIAAIHISHIHYDHFCPKDLESFRKDIPILISKYQNPDFVSSIRRAGFENIVHVGSGQEKVRMGDFTLSCFPKRPEDGSFDSSCVVEIAEKNYYLNNDCIHGDVFYHVLSNLFGPFQGAFLGYAVANPLPWGTDFSICDEFKVPMDKTALARHAQKSKWTHVAKIANILNPTWAVPYASSYRFLSADLSHLNHRFGFDEEIYDLELKETRPVVLKHGETVLCESGARLDSKGEILTVRSHPTSPVVPEHSLQSPLFESDISDAEFSNITSEATDFFLKLFSRQGTKWGTPLDLEIQIHCGPKVRSLFYSAGLEEARLVEPDRLSSVDAVVRLPASALVKVLSQEMSLPSFYYLFCTEVRWKKWKYEASNFLKWL